MEATMHSMDERGGILGCKCTRMSDGPKLVQKTKALISVNLDLLLEILARKIVASLPDRSSSRDTQTSRGQILAKSESIVSKILHFASIFRGNRPLPYSFRMGHISLPVVGLVPWLTSPDPVTAPTVLVSWVRGKCARCIGSALPWTPAIPGRRYMEKSVHCPMVDIVGCR